MKTSIIIEKLNLQLGQREVLQDIDLSLMQGELVALLGPNGAGKTSLLRCLAGLIPADSGQINISGQNLSQLDRWQRARSIAYLEQNADCHWPMTVEDVVALGRLPHRLGGSRINPDHQQKINQALADSDLTQLRKRRVDGLSGGERRRVMLARTLATETGIILADEPIAGLDPAHQLHMMELLVAKAGSGVTVIVVLHDLALAARYCDRLVLLESGKVIADGSANEVITREILAATYGIDAYIDEANGLPVIIPITANHRNQFSV